MRTKVKIFAISIAAIAGAILAGVSEPSSINSFSKVTHSNSKASTRYERTPASGPCFGRSDYPHESVHVPYTVNVTAETVCPGKEVSIRTTLYRHRWLIFRDSVSASNSGKNSVRINVALKYKWKSGDPAIEYVVESAHKEQGGSIGVTRLHRYLKC